MARGIAQNVDSASKDGRPAFMNRLDTGAFNYDLRLQEYDGPQERLVRDPTDSEVCGIPIIGYITNLHGQSEALTKPIDGFAHLWKEQDIQGHFQPASRVQVPVIGKPTDSLSPAPSQETQTVNTRELSVAHITQEATEMRLKARKLIKKKSKLSRAHIPKRSRSTAQLDACDQEGDDEDSPGPSVVNLQTFSFNIGDENAVVQYFIARFEELKVNPLRHILTEWLTLAEPKRRKFGSYHGITPAEAPDSNYPSWWPSDVIYREPSHLNRPYIFVLGARVLMLHRYPDSNGKTRINWIAKLKRSTYYFLENKDAAFFSSAKNPKYSAAAKERAAKEIFPDLFDVAQSYEDHVAQYELYEGMEKNASTFIRGKQHTWTPASKMPRAPASRRPRGTKRRCSETERRSVYEGDDTDWGSETDQDEARNAASENGSSSSILSPEQRCLSQPVKEENVEDHQNNALIVSQQAMMPNVPSVTTTHNMSTQPPVLTPQGPLTVSPSTFVTPMDALYLNQRREVDFNARHSFAAQWSTDTGEPHSFPMDHASTWTYGPYLPSPGPNINYPYAQFSGPGVGSNTIRREQRETDKFVAMQSPHLPYHMSVLNEKPNLDAPGFSSRPTAENNLAATDIYSPFGTEVPKTSVRAPENPQSTLSSEAPNPYNGPVF